MSLDHPNIMQTILNSSLITGGFPPSFEGNPWVFTSALFCTMIATLVSMTQIFDIYKEMKAIPDKIRSPINIYRIQLMLMYLFVILGVGPDAVYLWTYGEVSADTTTNILLVDRTLDSIFIIPFMVVTWLQIKCGPVLKFQLIRRPSPIDISIGKPKLRFTIVCWLAILLMSVLVTISK